MIVRCLLVAVAGFLLCAAAEPLAPPALLQPYIKDGHFLPGDYGWMKGRFDDASPEEKAKFQSVRDWFGQCLFESVADAAAFAAPLAARRVGALAGQQRTVLEHRRPQDDDADLRRLDLRTAIGLPGRVGRCGLSGSCGEQEGGGKAHGENITSVFTLLNRDLLTSFHSGEDTWTCDPSPCSRTFG